MPKSKKRKKVVQRNAARTRRVNTLDIDAVRDKFVNLAINEGHVFPAIKGYEPFGPPVECWTNAWIYSEATGLGYAEGVALMPNGWHAHAWCVTTDGAVIEPTLGYDHATEYRGWCLNLEGVHAVRALLDEGPRTSFLESGLGSGVATWEQIRDRFTYIPGTA